MATLTIKASTVIIPEKRAAEICGLFGELGIEFTFVPTCNPNPKRGHILLGTPNMSVRAQRVIKTACELHNLEFNKTCISKFCEVVSQDELIKVRNCGKRALEEINSMLWEYGYSLA